MLERTKTMYGAIEKAALDCTLDRTIEEEGSTYRLVSPREATTLEPVL